jgi:hypothetical protein
MRAVPKPGGVVLAYFLAQFLVGVLITIRSAHHMPSLLDLGHGALTWLFVINVLFLWAPWVHQTWLSPVIVVLIPIAIVAAWLRLKGWMRLIAIVSLFACLNAYSCYVAMLAGA